MVIKKHTKYAWSFFVFFFITLAGKVFFYQCQKS